MERADFLSIVDEIEKFYLRGDSSKELTEFECERWFDEVGKWSKDRFHEVMEECFRTVRNMPKLVDILACERNLPRNNEIEQIDYYRCDKCCSTGLIKYPKRVLKCYDYSWYYYARCDCENGKRYINLFPTLAQAKINVEVFEKKSESGQITEVFRKLTGNGIKPKIEKVRTIDNMPQNPEKIEEEPLSLLEF